MNKFSDIYAECAYAVASNGFEQGQFGLLDDAERWNALSVVCSVHLRALGENQLADKFESQVGTPHLLHYVWIRQDEQGFVETIRQGTGHEADRVVYLFDKAESEYDSPAITPWSTAS